MSIPNPLSRKKLDALNMLGTMRRKHFESIKAVPLVQTFIDLSCIKQSLLQQPIMIVYSRKTAQNVCYLA